MRFVGHVDVINRFRVAGWVADQGDWGKSLQIDILVNGVGVGACTANLFRNGLDRLHPEATGQHAFNFYFAAPLSMFEEQNVSVRVSGTEYYLPQQQATLSPIEDRCTASVYRPHGPILVSTMGRTGSTAVMALLAQHPAVLVAGEKPYEVEMACYYAYALRTLVAPGDHERSWKTDNITAADNRFSLGLNPYFEASFANVFSNPATLQNYLTQRVPGRLAAAFREIVLDYYEELGHDKSVKYPIYFAEKCLPERDARLGIRFMFPNVREILLVRDLRDVLCSAMKSNGGEFGTILQDTAAAGRQILRILAESNRDIHVLKYEDFVLERSRSADLLFQFLGVPSINSDQQKMRQLFASHATSKSPEMSIGRWKHDLNADQREQAKVLAPFLEAFGYND